MDTPASYVHWHFILIGWPNLALIIAMLVIFGLALVVLFPGHTRSDKPEP